jgi:TonB family protein
MNNLVQFAYESGICLAVLFALYWLVLRKETYFRLNRIYLLGTLAVSCVIPLIHVGVSLSGPEASSSNVILPLLESIRIPELSTLEASGATRAWPLLVLVLYLTGSLWLVARTLLGILRVSLLKKKGRIIRQQAYSIVYLKQEIAPFSFFRTIFLPESLSGHPDQDPIIHHERTHIRQGHSFDNIFVEFFLALFWFNPVMWLLKAALRNTHEYLADHGAISNTPGLAGYQSLLLKQVSGFAPMPVTSSFNSTIKKRLTMMHRNHSGLLAKFKPLLLIPVLTCLVVLFACTENEPYTEESEPLEQVLEEYQHQDDLIPAEEEIFYIVEEMPTFNGGEPPMEFRKFIEQQLNYPESAIEKGIEGRVIVQFKVDEKGKVVDAVVLRSVDPALDKEAIRLVNSSPDWTPGKQRGQAVKVLFTFPINFVLP